ncbi:nucleotidyltransferase family protein [Demetria terragena]|uniref:nucleotidyltransferase family protein n=1 Tax=Demetria terragena TaxID=63959 RepID=UPI0004755030|nr:nucleotidyltransferase family protein [Demetria terragena]
MTTPVAALLLAAGSGTRMGRPKALVRTPDGTPWVQRSVEALKTGGCDPVLVAVGAEADTVTALLTDEIVVAVADWADGMGASLRAGLAAASGLSTNRLVVSLVDLPDVGPEVVARLVADGGDSRAALARAAYGGVPGHPVLIGREHWAGVADGATGDQGARNYFRRHQPVLVECGDLATGRDIDYEGDLPT